MSELVAEAAHADALASPASDTLLWADFAGGSGASCLGQGWMTEDQGAVSVGFTSTLSLPGGGATVPLTVELAVEPWAGSPEVLCQLVNIRMGDHALASFVVTQPMTLQFAVPRDLQEPGVLVELALDYPCFVRPAVLGTGGDERALALTLRSLHVTAGNDGMEPHAVPPPVQPAASEANPVRVQFDFTNPDHRGLTLREGFHVANDGTVWTGAPVSRMAFEQPQDGAMLLRLSLIPLCFNGGPGLQRLTVILDGFVVGQFRLNTETTLTMLLPAELLARSTEHHVSMVTPDAVRMSRFTPGKAEVLGFAVDWVELEAAARWADAAGQIRPSEIGSATVATFDHFNRLPLPELEGALGDGLDLPNLFRKFESIGDSCTFGLAQRKVGVEVLNLLRFANTPIIGLLKGLRAGFSAATDKAAITVEKDTANELVVWIRSYGIRWHTFQYETSTTAAKVYEDHVVKLAYLRRKFLEGFRNGQKIYVLARLNSRRYRRAVPTASGVTYWEAPLKDLQLSEVMAIWQELNREQSNTLLYILPSDTAHSSGTVEQLTPTLLRGYLDVRVMRAVMDLSAWDHSDWARALANAWLSRSVFAQALH
jgi:hypothetical protein